MNSLVLSDPSKPPRSASDPDPEVPAKARRRHFTAKYKLRILAKADRCSKPGDIGELLRKEALYSSHLSKWRQQRDEGALAALSKKRGRRPRSVDPQAKRVAELERENARLRQKLAKAETIIEVQKKLSQLLESSEEASL
jgi:transposase-like protein